MRNTFGRTTTVVLPSGDTFDTRSIASANFHAQGKKEVNDEFFNDNVPCEISYDCRLVSSGRASLDNLRSMLLVGDLNSEPVPFIWPGYELTRQLALRAIECCIRR